jgi:hypothetical protein
MVEYVSPFTGEALEDVQPGRALDAWAAHVLHGHVNVKKEGNDFTGVDKTGKRMAVPASSTDWNILLVLSQNMKAKRNLTLKVRHRKMGGFLALHMVPNDVLRPEIHLLALRTLLLTELSGGKP